MRAETADAVMPFPLASSANCLFNPSNPPPALPHCAPWASLAINIRATATTITAVLVGTFIILMGRLSCFFDSMEDTGLTDWPGDRIMREAHLRLLGKSQID